MTSGSCSCGELKYEFQGEPAATVACHCLPCRKSSGTIGSTNLIVPDGQFRVTSDKSLKTWERTADSGKKVTNHFCGTCGNLAFVKAEAIAGRILIKYGLLDDPEAMSKAKPVQEIYCRSMAAWEPKVQDAQQKEHV